VIVVLGIVVGIATVRFLRMVSGDILASPALERRNYRDRLVPTAGGLYIVITVLVIEAGRAIFGALGVGDYTGLSLARSEMLFAVFGFAFLGLVDDLTAVGSDRGFRGHLGALRKARVTTGLLKLVAGAAIAIVLVATPGFKSGRSLIVDALLIALAANFGNLLDRAPGRTIKGGLVVYIPLAIVLGTDPTGVALAPVMGASFGVLGDDLHERLMLGDTGANVIGAALGLGVVLGTEEGTRIAVMLILLLLNVAAELVSFSDVIDAVPPLRWFDRLGRVDDAPRGSTPRTVRSPVVHDDVAEPFPPVAVRRQPRPQVGEAPEVSRRGDDDSADAV
jgi:UDP-N-acetylmuramyl pentapeptide phosphotransferase/UDP-N-acetylglucosamine-1-phosphate transferase